MKGAALCRKTTKKEEEEEEEKMVSLLNRHSSKRSALDGDCSTDFSIYSPVAVTRGPALAHRACAVVGGGALFFLFKGVFCVAILAKEGAEI